MMGTPDSEKANPWSSGPSPSPPASSDAQPALKPWAGRSAEFSVSRGMPFSSFSTRPRIDHPHADGFEPYVEPGWEQDEPVRATEQETRPETSYPPAAPSPFAASGSTARKPVLAHAESGASGSGLSGTSAPGEDGPLSYTWTPGGTSGRVILGVALVDFNHLVGPTVEFSYPPSLCECLEKDDELCKLLPFLALPDGAHLSEEDYSYFHCVYSPTAAAADSPEGQQEELPRNQTIFGISCNRQLASSDLLNRTPDITRSTVQKAVVVLASRPVFGPIRDKLGVVTRAFFAQRDFTQTDLLPELYNSLESGLKGKENEAGMYIGTSLRELVHKFRHRTLTLVKLMMLQKRIMLFGYPVERLCTYEYSLISLMPGLLMNLADAGSPKLDFRSGQNRRASSLRTSDRNSLLRYMGLPLHTFGADSFFQPYLPLQQIDMLKSKSWLVGTTNSIVTQQRDCQWDLLVNIEHNTFEFHDPKLERLVNLTSSDRAWMDGVVRSVEETWNTADPTRPIGMAYQGSDDDLRSKFEEYICAALSTIKYSDFVASGSGNPHEAVMMGMPGAIKPDPAAFLQPFSEAWLTAFRQTSSCRVWEASTDPLLFDICEPRHPSEGKASTLSDIGIRLTEGLHDLRLDQQLAPTREAIGQAFSAGSSTLFRAFDGVRSEVSARLRDREQNGSGNPAAVKPAEARGDAKDNISGYTGPAAAPASSVPDIRATLGGIGSFFGAKVASLQQAAASARAPATGPAAQDTSNRRVSGLKTFSLRPSPAKPSDG